MITIRNKSIAHSFRILLTSTFLLLSLSIPHVGKAQFYYQTAHGPVATQTQHPFFWRHLAMPLESARPLPPQKFSLSSTTGYSNLFEKQSASSFQNIDMELVATRLNLTYAPHERWDVSFTLPLFTNGGGFLDPIIQNYHNAFHFPNAGRENVPNNDFHYVYQDRTTRVDFGQQNLTWGDSSLRLKYRLTPSDKGYAIALAPYVKLPTGNDKTGLSANGQEMGLAFFGELNRYRWHAVSQLGLVVSHDTSDLAPIMTSHYFVFGQSFEYQFSQRFAWLSQITGSTSVLKPQATGQIDDLALDFSNGFSWRWYKFNSRFYERFFKVLFTEDLTSKGPSADFTFYIVYGTLF